MKKAILISVLLIMSIFFISTSSDAAQRVRGHWKDTNRDGIKDTYVESYTRTSPNSSRTDNYSYPGNYNPNTGTYTPNSNSPRELYPYNPNPYEKKY